ncbi:MAG: hypothetical protein MT490_05110 [Sphingomonas sp.]|uniref:hypothetical protein n=1 Tax=Sphingomonas sp. TaxID=28214 RepID=UPI00227525FB|nr:hypothetical protein [Sphingomonas sp.]MCX8475159.1 hypothetical protein [Sphingomonas sp.]
MSLLERYRDGDYIRVWEELRALGEKARDPDIIEDANAVAAATMKRAAANFVRIERELRAGGYRFGWSIEPTLPKISLHTSGPLKDLRFRLDSERVGSLSHMIATMLRQHSSIGPDLERRGPADREDHQVFSPMNDAAVEQLERFEAEAGPVPLSLYHFWREVGGVDFMGQAANWDGSVGSGDPVVLNPPDQLMDAYEDEAVEGQPFSYILGPDADSKGGYSGSVADVLLPDSRADFQLPGYDWFVDYLRQSTRLAGFPGFGIADNLPPDLKAIAAAWLPF